MTLYRLRSSFLNIFEGSFVVRAGNMMDGAEVWWGTGGDGPRVDNEFGCRVPTELVKGHRTGNRG